MGDLISRDAAFDEIIWNSDNGVIDARVAIDALRKLPSVEPERKSDSMTVDDYRDRMIEAFHNADCDELIALIVLPSEKEFEHLEWLLKNHYRHSVPERKSGKWIRAIDPDVNAWTGGHACSECGRACVQMSMNFCANCGAPMEVDNG